MPTPSALGWFSLGLAAATCLAPRAIGRLTGLGERSTLLRVVGLRELASGVGLLTQQNRTPWLLARVAGDVMDLAIALSAVGADNPRRARAFATLGVVGAVTVADLSAWGHAATRSAQQVRVYSAVVVNKSAQECYEFWRDVSHLPKFMHWIETVTPIDERRSRWTVRTPMGARLEWNAELTEDDRSKHLTWRARDNEGMQHMTGVWFGSAKGVRGTLVQASLQHFPAAARGALSVRKLFATDPESVLREDLRRFKQLIEAGEIPTTRGQPSGRRSLLGRLIPEGRLSRERGMS